MRGLHILPIECGLRLKSSNVGSTTVSRYSRNPFTNSASTCVSAARMQQGQQVLNYLHQNIESNLARAKHTEGWEWKGGGGKPMMSVASNHFRRSRFGSG